MFVGNLVVRDVLDEPEETSDVTQVTIDTERIQRCKAKTHPNQFGLHSLLSRLAIATFKGVNSKLVFRLLCQHNECLGYLVAEFVWYGDDTAVEDVGVFEQVAFDLNRVDAEAFDFHEVLRELRKNQGTDDFINRRQ